MVKLFVNNDIIRVDIWCYILCIMWCCGELVREEVLVVEISNFVCGVVSSGKIM